MPEILHEHKGIVIPEWLSYFNYDGPNGINIHEHSYVLLRLPTEHELISFICTQMINGIFCLQFDAELGNRRVPENVVPISKQDALKALELLTALALKYRPWQQRVMSQISTSYEFNWVEGWGSDDKEKIQKYRDIQDQI